MTGAFWWLEALGLPLRGEVRVRTSRWIPSTETPVFELASDPVTLDVLELWAAEHSCENVHGSLEVLPTTGTRSAVTGPFVVDIDVEGGPLEDGQIDLSTGLEAAGGVGVAVVNHFRAAGVSESDMRI